jgi:hypothetical protein
MAVQLPKDFKTISENLIYFQSDYKGKNYHNIRKTYEKDGETFLGKGLTIGDSEWGDFLTFAKGE